MKVLLATLIHNTPELAENIVSQWKGDTFRGEYEIMVVDNGSQPDKISSVTTHKLSENVYFGGGFNVIMDYFLQGDYDYLAMFNSDIVYHGHNFLNNCFDDIEKYDLDIYTPSVLRGQLQQCDWKPMLNWGTKGVRLVKYIDDECPIFSRRMIEKLNPLPHELYLGYGTDFYECIIANRNNYNIGVSDSNTVLHLENYTVKQDKLTTITKQQYYNDNFVNMQTYFNNSEYAQEYQDLFKYGKEYKWE